MSKKGYDEIKNCMQPGDVIAFSGENIISECIKIVTEGQISHVGIVLDVDVAIDGNSLILIAEADAEGVRIISLTGLQKAYEGKIWWLPLSCESREKLKPNLSCFRDFLICKDGKPYDCAQAIMEGLAELIGDSNHLVRLVRKLWSLFTRGKGIEYIEAFIDDDQVEQIKNKKDFRSRLIQALRGNSRLEGSKGNEDAKKYFCSELVTHALKIGGVLPDKDNIDPKSVTPNELCQFNIYKKCVQFKGDGTPEDVGDFNSKNPCEWRP